MCMVSRALGAYTVIPGSVLLTLSFFVLFAIRKIEARALKAFGYLVVICLCLAAALIFSTGVFIMATGRHPILQMMQSKCQMMQSK